MMYDIHNHLVVGVDDGCKDMETALELLRLAQKEGIQGIITTPHYMNEGRYRLQRNEILPHFELLQQKAKEAGITIDLYLGNEIYCSNSSVSLLEQGKISSMNGSRYVLVEFSFMKYKQEYDEYLYNLALAGHKIIIAHVERYAFVREQPEMVYNWIQKGYYCQMNQDSITGKNGPAIQQLSFDLLEANQIHFVCSDAHRLGRIVTLKDAYDIVEKRYGLERAKDLFANNPLAVIEDRPIELVKPSKLRMKSFLQKLLGK